MNRLGNGREEDERKKQEAEIVQTVGVQNGLKRDNDPLVNTSNVRKYKKWWTLCLDAMRW